MSYSSSQPWNPVAQAPQGVFGESEVWAGPEYRAADSRYGDSRYGEHGDRPRVVGRRKTVGAMLAASGVAVLGVTVVVILL